jgi:CubicO group peptidase (beta-lactamase class C family)
MKFRVTEFEQYMKEFIEETKAPGMAVSVVAGGEVVYAAGFGTRDAAKTQPVTPETIFGVASVSKSFTCLGILQLAESGRLSVNDPVQKYIPGFDLPGGGGDKVTIHHFMTHSAGIPPLPTLNYSIRGNTAKDACVEAEKQRGEGSEDTAEEKPFPRIDTFDQLVDYIREGDYKVLGPPGDYCSYSNDTYGLLGLIIEKVTGQRFEEYMQENVLSPLEMERSMYDLRDLMRFDNVTTLYWKPDGDEIKQTDHWQVAPPFTACGWLKSTVMDLSNYLRMHIAGGVFRGKRLLSEAGIRAMASPHMPYSRDRMYGYGFSRRADYHGVTLVEHSGGLRGVASNIGFVPEKGVGVAVLSNLSGTPSARAWLAAVNLILGLPVDTPRSVYRHDSWPLEDIGKYTGTFKSGEGATIVLLVKEDSLVATVDKKEYEVRRDSPTVGVAEVNGQDTEVRFHFSPEGDLWAIGWGGRIIPRSQEA